MRPFVVGLVCLFSGCSSHEPHEPSERSERAPPESSDPGEVDPGEVELSEPSGATPASSICPPEMVLVEGDYCPDVVHVCKRWVDPPGRFRRFRCAEYAPSVCKSRERRQLRFCIDRDEYTRPGETLPEVNLSWSAAGKTCAKAGKRLCLESEWQFACEGQEMRPYPYGFVRDVRACNIDRENIAGKTGPIDQREPAGSHPRCVSSFGVRDMSGNIEEWATIDGVTVKGQRSTMKGAWWLPGRNHCRARTLGHGEIYYGPQIGVRCCQTAR